LAKKEHNLGKFLSYLGSILAILCNFIAAALFVGTHP
jgi:hypothetical protein